ncbi:MAG: hypothetical protein IIT49_01760 [Clostridia bacterium]|nr:hypothetical protein [Clostridia bacterium]MBQ5439490.1 hypothetical protein [Clostridia bacterium]
MTFINTAVKTILKVLLILILLAALLLLICTALIFQDDNTDKYNTAPDQKVLETIAKNAVIQNETELTEDDLNGLFAFLLQKVNDKNIFSESYSIKAVYFEIHKSTPCKLYIQSYINGRSVGFSADVDIFLDAESNVTFTFSNAKAGKLNIPGSVLTLLLKKTKLQNASEYISINDLSVTLPAHYEYDIPKLGTLINIEVSSIEINDGVIHISTNPVLSDALDNIKGFLWDGLGYGLEYGIDYFKDNILGDR